MDPTNRLRIATRIHFALLRQYGEQVPVSSLLAGDAEAREALWVCEASDNAELAALAKQLREAPIIGVRMPVAPPGEQPQAMPWGQDTSGFGVSAPAPLADAPKGKMPRWFGTSRWLRGAARTGVR